MEKIIQRIIYILGIIIIVILSFIFIEVIPNVNNTSNYDLIVFSGQSNMVGCDTKKYLSLIPKNNALEYKMKTDSLEKVTNPTGENILSLQASLGSSIVPRFVEEYIKKTNRKVIVVHAARGGTLIQEWAKGGLVYNSLSQKLDACLDYLENKTDFVINHKIYVFHQGCSDCYNNTSKDEYKKLFLEFHDLMINTYNFNFGVLMQSANHFQYEDREQINTIADAKTELAKEYDDLIMGCEISLKYGYDQDYLIKDGIHLSKKALKLIAEETANNIINYLGDNGKSQKGIDPVYYLEKYRL